MMPIAARAIPRSIFDIDGEVFVAVTTERGGGLHLVPRARDNFQ